MGETLELNKEESSKKINNIMPYLGYGYPLFMACMILLTTSALQHCVRGSLAFLFGNIGIHPSQHHLFSAFMMCSYIPGMLLSLFTGQLNDMMGDFTTLMFFSVVSTMGALLLYICASMKTTIAYYYASFVLYGMGQILLRIPVKRLISNVYEGPYLAVALNINHNASHLAGILGGYVMSGMMPIYSVPNIFLIITVWTSLSIPVVCFLYGKLDFGKQKKLSLKKSLIEFFQTTDRMYYLVGIGGCLLDCAAVSYKNVESYIFKSHASTVHAAQLMRGISFAKTFNLIGPFISYLMDLYPHRALYLLISGINMTIIYIIFAMFVIVDATVHKNVLILISVCFKLNLVLFYSSLFPSIAILVKKHLRGTGFGILFTVDNAGFVLGIFLYSLFGQKTMFIYLGITVAGTLVFLYAYIKSIKEGSHINKKL
eukprot:GAHX01000198.1.p1 GENE.GAHX01000198.1~~GAHX01000198.1.p1  ORF type:complete len:428 (+),score=38.64 GAHX01000198.1:43-1326(+)